MAQNIFEQYGIKEVADVQFEALESDKRLGVEAGVADFFALAILLLLVDFLKSRRQVLPFEPWVVLIVVEDVLQIARNWLLANKIPLASILVLVFHICSNVVSHINVSFLSWIFSEGNAMVFSR